MSEQSKPTALVVIDMQVAMVDEFPDDPAAHNRDALLANTRTLLNAARDGGAKVVFVRHKEDRYELMRPGHPAFEVHSEIAPIDGETVIDKTACDSFCGTDLDSILRNAGIEHLVTCGMQTEMCVDSTTRSAVHRGFNVTLATDAHSTWDSGELTADQIIAHTNRTLAGIPGPGTGVTAKPSAEIEFARAGA
jgi:nicotinamidase-related amidase